MTSQLTNALSAEVGVVLCKQVNIVQEQVAFALSIVTIVVVLIELQYTVLGGVHQKVNAALFLGLV